MNDRSDLYPVGPYEADEIREGDGYELSHGYKIECLPTGGRGSDAAATGAAVLKSDPDVTSAGVETGFSPSPQTLRAPDVAVGNVPREPGWVKGAPPLAVEYADTGQDEVDFGTKIRELLDAGTQMVWVVRLIGPRRVEVYRPGRKMELVRSGGELRAPGILRNPVPVEALYDWEVGREVTLRNLLQRRGYDNLDAVRAEGGSGREIETLRRSILEVLAARELASDGELRTTIASCRDVETLTRWLRRAATVASATDVIDPATA